METPSIPHKKVESSNIHSIAYFENTNTLEVQFKNGSVYQYFAVPRQVYDELMKAPSKGSYLNAVVKKKYTYKKVATRAAD